ncbi:MAG: DUF3299 domain-containing protein [Opitutaceae bacterium]|nr:DUF3299 domain-containing protein [Opitutaceae bacterium]
MSYLVPATHPLVSSPSGEPAVQLVESGAPIQDSERSVPKNSATRTSTPRKDDTGRLEVEFAFLAGFEFKPITDPAKQVQNDQSRIPSEVLALDKQNVRVRGFVMPLTLNAAGRVESCVVVRNTMICCYGVTPEPNEWIVVSFRDPVPRMPENVPLFFYGRLQVGETYENGEFSGLYRLECVAASPRPLRSVP